MKLVKFLQKLNREQVTIELKNGTVISGTVVGVDATMNAHLKKAKLTARGKNPVSYATLSVRGSTVRAWLLPDGLNLDALLVEENKKVRYFCLLLIVYIYFFGMQDDYDDMSYYIVLFTSHKINGFVRQFILSILECSKISTSRIRWRQRKRTGTWRRWRRRWWWKRKRSTEKVKTNKN